MGEAKRIVTFEERKAAAIERDGVEWEERKRIEAENLAAMTEEERQRRRERERAMVMFMAQCHAMGVYPFITPTSYWYR